MRKQENGQALPPWYCSPHVPFLSLSLSFSLPLVHPSICPVPLNPSLSVTERGWERKTKTLDVPSNTPSPCSKGSVANRFPPFLPSVRHYSRLYCNKLKGKQHSKKGSVCSGSRSRNPSRPDSLYKLFFPPNAAHVLSLSLSFFPSLPLGGSTNESAEREKACELRKSLSSSSGLTQHFSLQCLWGLWEDLWHFRRWGYFPNQRLSVSKVWMLRSGCSNMADARGRTRPLRRWLMSVLAH